MNRKRGNPTLPQYKDDIKKIIFKIQNDLISHSYYISELKRIYTEMDPDDFMNIMISILMFFMQQPKGNTNSNTVLKFLCKFFTLYIYEKNENPCRNIFNFLLSTEGANSYIQFRLCQLMNTLLISLGKEVSLDDEICVKIKSYMLDRLSYCSAKVRAQAIYALERLQMPNDPNDSVTKCFIYHMAADPSAEVREAIISRIARNIKTIPIIMERLQDVKERVRRHTYIELMKGFPVKSLRITQRLTFLEYGLTDESKSIQEIVSHLMMTEWVLSYDENYITFLRAVKLNGSDGQLQRYQKTIKIALQRIFKRTKLEKLLAVINSAMLLNDSEEPNEPSTQFNLVIPIEHITLEHSLFWMNLTEYLYIENFKDVDLILPDLTTYCEYLTRFYGFISNTDNSMHDWQKLESEYIFMNLITNLKYFDYSDIIGKNNLINLICHILKNYNLNDYSIESLIKVMAIIVPNTIDRLPMLKNIVIDLYQPDHFEFLCDRPNIKELLQSEINANILLTVSELKLKILDLTEQIANISSSKAYANAEDILTKLHNSKMEYHKALMPFINCLSEADANSISLTVRKISSDTILKCLKIIFYMISTSDDVTALTPSISSLYSDFIRWYTSSKTIGIRVWAVKCGASFAILHESVSRDMFLELHSQIFASPSSQIFKILIRAIFQLAVRYDLEHFESTTNGSNQLLADTEELNYTQDNDVESTSRKSHDEVNWLLLMSHLLDTCSNPEVTNTIIEGFCLLCLNTKCSYPQIITKLMINYFNPDADPKANQMLGVFFETLIIRGKAFLLEEALLPTITEIVNAGHESPLARVKPENVIRFIIKANSSKYSLDKLNVHEFLAESFLRAIEKNVNTQPQLALVLSSELVRLCLHDKCELKTQLLEAVDVILVNYKGDKQIKKNLNKFKKSLNRGLTPTTISEISTNRSIDQDINTTTGINNIKHLSEDDDALLDRRSTHSPTDSKSNQPDESRNLHSLPKSFLKDKNHESIEVVTCSGRDTKTRSKKKYKINSSRRRSLRKSTRSRSKGTTIAASHHMVTRSKSN